MIVHNNNNNDLDFNMENVAQHDSQDNTSIAKVLKKMDRKNLNDAEM